MSFARRVRRPRRKTVAYRNARNQALRFASQTGTAWYIVRTKGGQVLATSRPRQTDTVLETFERPAVPA